MKNYTQAFFRALRGGDQVSQPLPPWRLGVVQTAAPLTVLFDGEDTATLEVAHLGGYVPIVGHRVLCAQVNASWVVLERVGTAQSTQTWYASVTTNLGVNNSALTPFAPFVVTTGHVYAIDGFALYLETAGSTAADFKLGFTTDGVATGTWSGGIQPPILTVADMTNTTISVLGFENVATSQVITAGYQGGGYGFLPFSFTFFCTASGTINLAGAQNTATAGVQCNLGKGSRATCRDIS